MHVNFVDLKAQYLSLKTEIDAAIQRIIDNTAFTLGEEVEKFEKNFAQYCKTDYCIGVSSGTDALRLALLACGIDQGDEVLLPANTFIATAEAISHVGAKPVFVDIDEKTYNIDTLKIEENISRKTKAIIPVHLYGQICNMESILEIAQKYNLKVIEDACQAHGSEIYFQNKWWRAGEIGDIGCFSFYPGKNLGAFGDGGAVVTNDSELAYKVRLMRNHGEDAKYVHSVIGYCDRLHSIQAAVLNVKLTMLDEWNARRRDNASIYHKMLEDLDVVNPSGKDSCKQVYHLYVIRVRDRDNFVDAMKQSGVYTGIHYPTPIHLQEAYRSLGHKEGDFPVSERLSREIVSLPMYPELDQSQIQYVAKQVKELHSGKYED